MLMSSLNTTRLTSAQKVAILNFVYEVKSVRIRYHPLYLLTHLFLLGLVATLFALAFAFPLAHHILLISATLLSMVALLFILRFFYIVRSSTVRWQCLVKEVGAKLPEHRLVRGRHCCMVWRMYLMNCRGLEFKMELPESMVTVTRTSRAGEVTEMTKKEGLTKHINESTRASNKRLTVEGAAESLYDLNAGRRTYTTRDLWNEDSQPRQQPLDTSILEHVGGGEAEALAGQEQAFRGRTRSGLTQVDKCTPELSSQSLHQ